MRSQKRKYRKPLCRKQGKKCYSNGEVKRLEKKRGDRFYWCSACRAMHKTTQEPGIQRRW